MSFWQGITLTHQLVAEVSLAGMGFDALGGCYLAYDLLGGKDGPLRTISRAAGYIALFLVGYAVVLGLPYALVAATGMGVLLAIEYRFASSDRVRSQNSQQGALLFGFLRGLVLGLASVTTAGPFFGACYGVLAGLGLAGVYAIGFGPRNDYATKSEVSVDRRKITASVARALAVGAAGVISGLLLLPAGTHRLVLGLRLGLAAGVVSALVGLFSPMIEYWIENLPDRRLGVLGLGLIVAGMALQSVQYWIVVFNLPVH